MTGSPKNIFVVSLWANKDETKQEKLDKWFGGSEIKADHFRPKSWAQLGPPSTLPSLECTQTVTSSALIILHLGKDSEEGGGGEE